MKTAIVTGANGWIGKNLVNFLAHGHDDHVQLKNYCFDEIRCLILPEDSGKDLSNISPKVVIVKGDITQKETLTPLFHNLDGEVTLFHTAGIIHPKKIGHFFTINVHGAINILEQGLEKNVDKMVFISSNSPFGCNPFADHSFTEESPYNPYMNYGKSKMEMELAIKSRIEKSDLSATIIRCPWFYGPYQPARQTTFFSMIKNGKMPFVGSGKNLRSMSYVDNLCQGILLSSLQKEKD